MDRKMILYKGTAFISCFWFTILGLVCLLLLHYVRIAAVVYSLLTYGVLPAVLLLPGEVLYFGLTCGREYRELKRIAKNRAKKEAQQ